MRRYMPFGLALVMVGSALCAISCAKKEDTTNGYVAAPANVGPDRKGGGVAGKNNLPANVQAGNASKE